MNSSIRMNTGAFRKMLREHLRDSGYLQEQLADAIGLNPKVLSRKLNGNNNAYLTRLEVQNIIKTLARWHVITTRDEARHLLDLAEIGPAAFSAEEWHTPPLSTLEERHARPTNSLAVSGPPADLPRHNLPTPMTRLIGRDWAIERLKCLLERDDVHLVTLVGTGGCGKTSLALQVAWELAGAFAQGAWLVSLAGVRDPSQVPLSIMQALDIKSAPGSSPLQSLISYLKNRQLLLLLDNFEHIREAASVVSELLEQAPGLKVLVTSRVVLRLYGEREFSVPPLDVPDPGIALGTKALLGYSAVQLFVERAQAVAPDFALTAENASAVVQICARVDGLPLALELAAARTRVLSPGQLLEHISRAPLSVLTKGAANLPTRQRALRGTITWSYDLLPSGEQVWFNRLGVFTGGWSFEAATAMMQAVATDQQDEAIEPLDMLEDLLDNSLLVRLPGVEGQARFTMLETLREYALERLGERGELEQLRDWHARYYLRMAEDGELGIRGPQQLAWLARLGADRDNFRAALAWSLQRAQAGLSISGRSRSGKQAAGGCTIVAGSRILSERGDPDAGLAAIELCLRLAAAFRPYWEWQGYLPEARNWLGAALALPLGDNARETTRAALAKALGESARLACFENEPQRAIKLAEEAIALWRQLDDATGLVMGLFYRMWAAFTMSDYETAERVCREGLQYVEATGDSWLHAQLLFYLGSTAGFRSDFDQMWSLHAQSRKLFEQVGDRSAIADMLKDHGALTMLSCDFKKAIAYLLESIQMSYSLGHKQYITTGLCWLSLAFGLRGEPDEEQASIQSAQIESAATALMEAIELDSWANTHPFVRVLQQQIRSRVDEQTWQAAWEYGRSLTLEQVIDLACRLGAGIYS